MALSAAEQYELELINRARLDPEAEAARHGISLNEGLAPGSITGAAKQVLAPNETLEAAAQGHSEWMLSADVFSHTGSAGSSAGDRMAAAGYVFSGSWGWSENLGAVLSTAATNLETAIEQHHSSLFLSTEHRSNTMNSRMREIGIAQVQGQFTQQGVTYNASMLTEKFAYSGTQVFLTGVAHADADNNAFYGIGEGFSGIFFYTSGAGDTSEAAGGYSVGLSQTGAANVSVSQGNTVLAVLIVDLSKGNAKLDLVGGADGLLRLELSASATLVSGVANATLLGVADLALAGHGGNNLLTGNKGSNWMYGDAGDDALYGGDGADWLDGGAGFDRLDGGTGADVLVGGLGRDTYVLDNSGDLVSQEVRFAAGGDLDTIESWISYALTTNSEILRLQGSADLAGAGRLFGHDAVLGNSGNNQLNGRGGSDTVIGWDGNDKIIGGHGQDDLIGATGADMFMFRVATESGVGQAERDVISGFDHGADLINLQAVDANAIFAGNQAFRFIGSAGFSGVGAASAGQLRVSTLGGGTSVLVEMDVNGDGRADMQIMVQGTSIMSAGDFIL